MALAADTLSNIRAFIGASNDGAVGAGVARVAEAGHIFTANTMITATIGACRFARCTGISRAAFASIGLAVTVGVVALVRTRIMTVAVQATPARLTSTRSILAVSMTAACIRTCTVLATIASPTRVGVLEALTCPIYALTATTAVQRAQAVSAIHVTPKSFTDTNFGTLNHLPVAMLRVAVGCFTVLTFPPTMARLALVFITGAVIVAPSLLAVNASPLLVTCATSSRSIKVAMVHAAKTLATFSSPPGLTSAFAFFARAVIAAVMWALTELAVFACPSRIANASAVLVATMVTASKLLTSVTCVRQLANTFAICRIALATAVAVGGADAVGAIRLRPTFVARATAIALACTVGGAAFRTVFVAAILPTEARLALTNAIQT